VLGSEYELFSRYYGIVPEMVWESDFYVPYRRASDMEFAKLQKLEPGQLSRLKAKWQNQLMQRRSERVFPGVDDKIITSWNALLIIGLADAFDAFGDARYLDEARSLYAFLKRHCYDEGDLRHSFKPGDIRSQGFLEDYAYLARAAFRLYQITSDTVYLTDAETLLDEIQSRYSEEDSSLYRYREDTGLVAKIIKTDDGVMPSPNTVVAGLLFELGHFYYRPEYLEKSRDMVRALKDRFFQMPENYAGWGQLLLQQQHPYFEVAIAGPQALEMRAQMAQPFHPDVLLVAADTPTDLPLFESRFDSETTRIFVCQDHTCRLPVSTVDEALTQLQSDPAFIFP
ncbi:MAG: thioredoxin domain-containing protein, partial [Robiginitalea sp.]